MALCVRVVLSVSLSSFIEPGARVYAVSAGMFFLGCGEVGLKLSCLFVSRGSRCVRFGSLKLLLAGSKMASHGP